jgi:superfamily II DNA or RNA helicase
LSTLLDELPALEKLVLYCENLEQMTLVAEELGRRGVVYSRFSGDESTKPESSRGGLSEREAILQNFTEGKVDALVAMKCLDEGVNIPTAETAIFLSSSGNEKEFIQRRGRMMRQSPSTGKLKARIFDFVALPDIRETKHDLSNDEKKIIENEMRRLQEFSMSALNATEVGYQIRVMLEKLGLVGEVELGRIV